MNLNMEQKLIGTEWNVKHVHPFIFIFSHFFVYPSIRLLRFSYKGNIFLLQNWLFFHQRAREKFHRWISLALIFRAPLYVCKRVYLLLIHHVSCLRSHFIEHNFSLQPPFQCFLIHFPSTRASVWKKIENSKIFYFKPHKIVCYTHRWNCDISDEHTKKVNLRNCVASTRNS